MNKFLRILIILLLPGSLLFGQVVGSLFTDVKARQVGDILSVIIIESTSGTQETRSKSSSKSGMAIDAQASGNIADFLPMFGGGGSMESSYNGSDGAEQKERLSGRITVRITEQTETGMFKIEGERTVGINGESTLMYLEGFVRPRDINTNNTIYSYNIADATITTRKDGMTNALFSDGTFPKILTFAIGGLMVAAATGYFVFQN